MKTTNNNSRIQSANQYTTVIAVIVTLIVVIAATVALKSVDSGIGKDVLSNYDTKIEFVGRS